MNRAYHLFILGTLPAPQQSIENQRRGITCAEARVCTAEHLYGSGAASLIADRSKTSVLVPKEEHHPVAHSPEPQPRRAIVAVFNAP